MRTHSLILQLLPGWRWFAAAIATGIAVAIGAMAYAASLSGTKWTLPQSIDTIAFDGDGKIWAVAVSPAVISLDPATNTFTTWTNENASIFGGNFGPIGVQASGGIADHFVWSGSGSSGDHINRLDTTTGEVLSWKISGQTCAQGVVAIDPGGNAWFGGNFVGGSRIERLDASTNTLTTWTRFVPFAGCTDVIGIDTAGDVWYCGRNLSNIGRLDPTTGEITEWDISGSIIDCHSLEPAGQVWFARNTPEIARLDGATNTVTTWSCPLGCGNVIGVSPESGGKVWFGESSRITSLEIATNHFEQYNSYPSNCGVSSARPFIAPDGQVWTTEKFVPICRFTAP